MPYDPEEPKPFKDAQGKQARTDGAFKNIQESEKRTADAKSARLKESRLKQEADDKAAARPKNNGRKARA